MITRDLANAQGFRTWLAGLPEDSISRLRLINRSTSSSHHVLLAIAFGFYDRHIFKLNRIITTMLVSRMKAEKAGKVRLVERINNFLDEIHKAVDLATNVDRSHIINPGQACQKPVRRVRRSMDTANTAGRSLQMMPQSIS
jgi:hypothetical protein